ncbi:hypothetical protein E4T56_gene8318 [Termitomyces sp. T112]|nr:hypothetical protein E4T56_gene8318 [Termitomyces sp. T112]
MPPTAPATPAAPALLTTPLQLSAWPPPTPTTLDLVSLNPADLILMQHQQSEQCLCSLLPKCLREYWEGLEPPPEPPTKTPNEGEYTCGPGGPAIKSPPYDHLLGPASSKGDTLHFPLSCAIKAPPSAHPMGREIQSLFSIYKKF